MRSPSISMMQNRPPPTTPCWSSSVSHYIRLLYFHALSSSKVCRSVCRVLLQERMADMVRKTALLIILLGAVVSFIALHACHLAGARIRRGRRKGLKRLQQGASASKGMGDAPARVESTGGGVGPMSALLGETRGGGRLPFDLQLSPATTMDVSRMVLVQRSGHGGGTSTQTMHATDLDDGMSMHRPNHVSRPAPSHAGPAASVPYHQPTAGAAMQERRPDLGGVAESPRCVERIVCRFNSLRATSDGDGARPDSGASEADHVDVEDDDGDDDEEDKASVKEAASSGMKKQASKGRGKVKGKDKEGDRNGEGGGKVWDREKDSGLQSYFLMSTKARKEKGYTFNLDRTLYDAIHIMQGNNQADHPPNLVDTDNRQGQQPQQGDQSQALVGGGKANTSASDNKEADAGDGCGSRSSSNDIHGKRKNARQLAFEAVTDVMKMHSTVVAESMDRASKRQCDVLQRQCDIMDREAGTQERQCEVLDVGQRMLCDALLKIASTLARD
ncbi:hypothetical protein CBR_g41729 [Chara braunii]|uniref:Uncharacterized protein n=1 Tax=Chara braunii TaxID=69332 RepID=A0A388LWG6_CHABU|nr:hypothetical protein CBR_g41729 [Chara braunii]|eukprot:GBG86667.1 hypothetical protein CBR_g41729 [Chara braunii]